MLLDSLTWYCVCVKLDNGTAFRSVPIPCIWLLRQVGSLFSFCCPWNKSKTCQSSPKLVNQVQNLSGKSKTCQASPKIVKQVQNLVKQVQNLSSKFQNLSRKSNTCQQRPKIVKQVQNLSRKSKTCHQSPKLAKQVQNLSSKWRAQFFDSERHTLVCVPICLDCIWQNLKLRTIWH